MNIKQQIIASLEKVFPNEKVFSAGNFYEVDTNAVLLTVSETGGDVFIFIDRYTKKDSELSKDAVELTKKLLEAGIKTELTVFDNRTRTGVKAPVLFTTRLNKKEVFKTSAREWIKRCFGSYAG